MLVRIDKTLSELEELKNNPSEFTIDQIKEVATMAINALHKQEIEHEKFVNASYEAVKKEEEKCRRYEKALKSIYEIIGYEDDEKMVDVLIETVEKALKG